MRRREALAGCAALLLLASGPTTARAQEGAAPQPRTVSRAVSRIVSLGGAVTETVFALGAGDGLVGCDLTSQHPAAATASLPKVGYVRALGAEGVLSLHPDLVLASADAGPPAALRQVEAASVPVVVLPEAHTGDAAVERLRLVGAALGRGQSAAEMADLLRADLDQVAADVAAAASGKRAPRVLFLLSAGRGAPMAAGAGTAAEAVIRLAGAANAVEGFVGYRPLSAEAVLLADPDVVVTTTQTLEGVGGTAGLMAAVPGLAGTRAGSAGRVAAFDALYLLGFGPRVAYAVRELATTLHPGATFRPVPPRPWTG